MRADWPGLLRLALALGLAPAAFWRTSLKEWRALTGGEAFDAMRRDALDALIRQYPDDHP